MISISLICLHQTEASLKKALHSAEPLKQEVQELFVQDFSLVAGSSPFWQNKAVSHPYRGKQAEWLNGTIKKLKSDVALILSEGEFLLPVTNGIFQKALTAHDCLIAEAMLYGVPVKKPLAISKELAVRWPFTDEKCLPFREAVLPSWLNLAKLNNPGERNWLQSDSRKKGTLQRKKAECIAKYDYTPLMERKPADLPSLTVIIPAYNMETFAAVSLVSCLLQSVLPDQIIAVDDGSADGTLASLKNWEHHPLVTIISRKNGGKARAFNEGLAMARSEFILELDADDWLDADAVKQIKQQLSRLPEGVSVLYGNLRYWIQRNIEAEFMGIRPGRQIKSRHDLLHYRLPLGPRIYRTETLKKGGGFPVIPFMDGRMYEDVSVLYKILGASSVLCSDLTVYNVRDHGESITKKKGPEASWNSFIQELRKRYP